MFRSSRGVSIRMVAVYCQSQAQCYKKKDDEDEIILSKNIASGTLIAKLGYEVRVEENVEEEKKNGGGR